MNYEEALKVWGAGRLAEVAPAFHEINLDSVRVEINFEDGWSDPDLNSYGSQDYSGTCWVEIVGRTLQNPKRTLTVTIPQHEFNFATVLGEIVAAGEGAVTA